MLARHNAYQWVRAWLIQSSQGFFFLLLVLSGLGFYFGSGVDLRLSLTDLLPEDHPAVVKFQKLTNIVGGVGFFTIILTAQDEQSHIRVAPQIIQELLKNPLLKSASYDREKKFFVDRMLYYLDLDQLTDMQKNMDRQIAKARSQVFDLGLWEKEPQKNSQPIFDEKLTQMAKNSAQVTPFLTSTDKKHLLIMAKPSFDSTDLDKTKKLLMYVTDILNKTLPSNVTYRFAERYYNKIVETEMIQSDIFILGSISLITIAGMIAWYLQSIVATLIIFVPVLIGLGLTMGITALVIGHINIITGFLIGILSGLGVDYSIHLFLRYKLEQREPSSSDSDTAWRTLSSTGHSVFVGALAASLAFYTLCFSSFRAFSEFGFICGTGIVCVFISLMMTFKFLSRFFDSVTLSSNTRFTKWSVPTLSLPQGLLGGVFVTMALILIGTKVSFLYDFDRMMKHSKEMEERNDLVDNVYGRSVVPSALATKTQAEALKIESLIKEKYMPHTVSEIISGASIVPEDQERKHALLRKMHSSVVNLKDKWVSDALGVPADMVRNWLLAKPFEFSDIPKHVQDSLRGNSDGYLLYIYPAIKLGTYDNIKTYSLMFREVEQLNPNVLSGSDAVIFMDILNMIQNDGIIILCIIFSVVGLFIWGNVKKWDDTLASYLPLLIALPVGMGLMVIFGVQFNILNITIIPSFVAMGIDVPIHLVHRAREVRSGIRAAKDIAASVNLALGTAVVGFGVLIFAKAGVLRSLGWIAALGTLAIWWIGLVVLPAWLEWMWFRPKKTIEPQKSDSVHMPIAK